MLGSCALHRPKKGSPALNSSPNAAPASLCPIPRRGLDGSAGVILHIFLLLSTLLVGVGTTHFQPAEVLVLNLPEGLTAAALFLLVIHLWRTARTAKGAVPLLVIIGAFLTFYTHSLLLAGILCGLVFTVSEGSLLIAVQPKNRLVVIPLIPLLGYGVTLLLSRDPIASLSVLLPWPAAWALAHGTRRCAASEEGPNRVGVICGTALAFGLSAAVLLAVSLLRALGTLHPDVLLDAFEAFRREFIDALHTQPMPEGMTPELIEMWKAMHTYANVENTVNTVFNLLPAICTVTALVFATLCQSIQHAALRAFGHEDCITDRVKTFEMSLLSCVVFLIAALSVMLSRGVHSTFFGAVAENIYIILLPGLALAGLLRMTRSLTKKGPRAMGCLFYVITLGFCLLFFAPIVLAATEVIGHVFEFISSKLRFEDDDDPFGGS
jgi:hypothetical protein